MRGESMYTGRRLTLETGGIVAVTGYYAWASCPSRLMQGGLTLRLLIRAPVISHRAG